jgi:hypothetical protein
MFIDAKSVTGGIVLSSVRSLRYRDRLARDRMEGVQQHKGLLVAVLGVSSNLDCSDSH